MLEVLPPDTDRGQQVVPVMKRVIGPYVFQGGGAKNLNYQSLAKDLAKATLEIPFNIPPYFALIARALGILEGVALSGDPDYRIVMEAYPFVTRRIIGDKSPALQCALRDILYRQDKRFLAKRLSVLLSYATGIVASDSSVFVDFDTLPSTGAKLNQTMAFLLGDDAEPLRVTLVEEFANVADMAIRRGTRQAVQTAREILRPPPPPLPFLPRLPTLPLPMVPHLLDTLSPQLSPQEDIFLGSVVELLCLVTGVDQDLLDRNPAHALQAVLQPGNNASAEVMEFVSALGQDSKQAQVLMQVGSDVMAILAGKARQRLEGLALGNGLGNAPRVL
ncbi:unnamed protein product [Discosporangium mesarthrocarpum]